MAIAKKLRFDNRLVERVIENSSFPPSKLEFEGKKLLWLGKSNKVDLIPMSLDNQSMIKASLEGKLGQFVYAAENADIYEVFLFVDEVENVIFHSIRTRLL